MYHNPVLLDESIEGLNIRPDGVYVDVTFGSGGHSRKILEKLLTGRLIAFDQDGDAGSNLIRDEKFVFINQNFRYIRNFVRFQGYTHIDGLLADLGISSWQIDQASRGFSTRSEGPLDMRMDQRQGITAEEIINTYPKERLIELFRFYGEVENPGRLSEEIVNSRSSFKIKTTAEFREIVLKHAPRGKENQYLAKVFQALRIEVNEELESLKDLLKSAVEMLNPGGRMVVIAYHSLEDRLVKNYIRTGNFEGKTEKDFFGNLISPFRPVNRKAIQPSEEELLKNPRSRSAKLRIAEKN
jgi:16S rRNA (cytosine1402-N4)-methyltransferase